MTVMLLTPSNRCRSTIISRIKWEELRDPPSSLHFPRLHVSCCNSQGAISLSKVQPPLALELYQAFSEYHAIDLALSLFGRARPKEWPLKPSHRPVCKFGLICASDDWIHDTGVNGRAKRPSRIDKHLTNRVLPLWITGSAGRHSVVDEEPGAIPSLDRCRSWLEKSILPRMYGRGEGIT